MQRTTKFGLLNYAHDYYDSYSLIQNARPKLTSLFACKFFLLGRVTELSLKALLLHVGFELSYIKKVGHDLQVLAALANIRFLELNLDLKELAIINLLNEYYVAKDFEYPKVGSKRVPTVPDVEKVITKLLRVADKYIIRTSL